MGATQSTVPAAERAQLSRVQVDSAVAGTLNLVAGVAGRVVRVYRMLLNTHAAQLATLQDTAPTVLIPQLSFGAQGGLALDFDGEPWAETAVGEGLDLVLTTGAQTSGVVYYTQREAQP